MGFLFYMSVTFPASIPSYPDTAGNDVLGTAGGGYGIARILDDYGLDIAAIAAKLGSGASTPVGNRVLRSGGAGVSSWGQVVLSTDVSGTLPVANGGTGMTAFGGGVAAFLATPNSANLRSALTDETGGGAAVFATAPTITNGVLVTPTIVSFTNATHDHTNAAGGGDIKKIDYSVLTTLSNPYKFRVWRNTALNSGNGAFAVVAFDSEQYDTNNNVASGVFTAPVTGFYQFSWRSSLTTSGTELFLASLFKNGSEVSRGGGGEANSVNTASGGTDLIPATAGDTFDVRTINNVARALNIGQPYLTFFTGHLVSRT